MSLSMALCVATMQPEDAVMPELLTWFEKASTPRTFGHYIQHNTIENNLGVVGAYDKLYRESTEDVLVYAHDDVVMREEGWDERIKQEFEADERVGVVGLGGALRHGAPELYKTPYKLQQLGRSGYLSNVDDAETHGKRFTGSCDVAVLDGFVVAVRRSLLDRMGGWSAINGPTDRFFCYDYAMCAWAHRLGYRVRVVGIRSHHVGGQTSVKVKDNPITGQQAYDESHRWFYENFRDVMPFRCD